MERVFLSVARSALCAVCILSVLTSVRSRPRVNETHWTGDPLKTPRNPGVLGFEPENDLYNDHRVGGDRAVERQKSRANSDNHSDKKHVGIPQQPADDALKHDVLGTDHDDSSQSQREDGVSGNEPQNILRDLSEEEHEGVPLSTTERDDCDIHHEHCSPFFGSPCNRISPAPEKLHEGKCHMSEAEAEGRWEPCGDVTAASNRSACYCYGYVASCCADLTSIPSFSNRAVRYLNFTSNSLAQLDDVVLRNWTRLRWLILNRNNVSVITKDALHKMKFLEHFELAYNDVSQKLDPVNFTAAVNGLSRTLKVLALNYTNFSPVNGKEFGITSVIRGLRLGNLTQLFLDGGPLCVFYLSDVRHLHKLCKLSLKSNVLENLYCCSVRSFNDSFDDDNDDVLELNRDYDANRCLHNSPRTCVSPESRTAHFCKNFTLASLQLIDLDNNSLLHVPPFCNGHSLTSGESQALPNLTHLSLALNALISPHGRHFKCLRKVRSMALTGNPLNHIERVVFKELTSLHDIDLRFTNVMRVDDDAFNHTELRRLTIKSSNWFMDKGHGISPNLFRGTSLTWVDLSYNVFLYADDDTVRKILAPLHTVKTLKMAEIGLKSIPDIVIDSFKKLEFFDFRSNRMLNIPQNAFYNMRQLRHLDFRHNDLANPEVDVIEALLKRNVSINLESNPFSCTCDLLNFLDLYKAYKDKDSSLSTEMALQTGRILGNHYVCVAPKDQFNHTFESVQLSVHNCLLTVMQEIIINTIFSLIIFGIIAFALLYKYRWQVRFWLYTMHVQLARRRAPGRRNRARFTAFVSYCKQDSNFVITKVLPALENTRHLPLCIHERDFIPGKYISQNVVERMAESRHILLILSNAFLRNDWCRFELFVAHRYGLIHRQIPVTILVLEPLSVELMDVHAITLLQATPGIEWPGRECPASAVERFWSRLAQTLGSNAG